MRFHRSPKRVALKGLSGDGLVHQPEVAEREFVTKKAGGIRLVEV